MIAENDEIKEKTKLYYCDPIKNKKCKKTWCYLKGGECFLTVNKHYAMLNEVKYDGK